MNKTSSQAHIFCATNDLHSHLDSAGALLDALDEQRAQGAILVDVGDFLEGTALYHHLNGQPELQLLDALYHYACPGNHGFGAMRHHTFERCKVLSLNLHDAQGPCFAPYSWLYNNPRSKLLITAVMPEQVFETIPAHERRGLRCEAPLTALERLFSEPGCQDATIILLSHSGFSYDLARFAALKPIKLIFASHCHSSQYLAKRGDLTIVTKAKEYAQGFVRVTLTPDQETPSVVAHVNTPPSQAPIQTPALSWLNAPLKDYRAHISGLVGAFEGPTLQTRAQLTATFVSAIAQANPDALFILNTTCLRSDLEPGPVSFDKLLKLFPFGNKLVSGQITSDALQRCLDALDPETRSHLVFSAQLQAPPAQPLQLLTSSYLWHNFFSAYALKPDPELLGLLRDHFTSLCLKPVPL